MYLNTNHSVRKRSYSEHMSQTLFVFIFFIVIIFAIISAIVLVARSKDLKFLLEYDPSAADGVRIFTYIILYSQMIPISMYFFLDVLTFFHKFQNIKQVNHTNPISNIDTSYLRAQRYFG